MTKNIKLMITLGAAVATGSAATAMLLNGGEGWHSMSMTSNLFNTDPGFGPPYEFSNKVADFNGDGYADFVSMVVLEEDDDNADIIAISFNLYEGDGQGTFTLTNKGPTITEADMPSPATLNSWVTDGGGTVNVKPIDVVDINGDGYLDLYRSLRYCEENDDGEYQCSSYILYLLNNNGNGFVCAGDVTGDGETNVNDILTVIEDWGCDEDDPLN